MTARQRRTRLSQRDVWLTQIDPAHLFYPLFDLLSGVSFFAKDRAGKLMLMSRSNRAVYNLHDDAEVVGLTDFDLNPSDMARSFLIVSSVSGNSPNLVRALEWSQSAA